MTIRCKATILRQTGLPQPYADSLPLSVEEVILDAPHPTEVVVKIAGAGLCHTDLSVINGTRARAIPIALGHEGSGEIVELGSAVTDLSVGDHIVFQFSPSCGRCRRCLEGRPQICMTSVAQRSAGELMTGGRRIRDSDGREISHHSGVSCFAEYAVVDRGSVVVIDRSVPLADAALFGCAVMTGVGAVVNTARIRAGDSVAVVGLGGIGLCGLMGAKIAGADTIIAVDLEEVKLATAQELGATHTFNAKDPDLIEKVHAITSGGVDFAFEFAGAIAAMKTAYALTARGGSVVSAGLSPAGSEFSFEHSDLVTQEKSIRGSYMGSCVAVRDIPRFIHLYQRGLLPVDKLIENRIGFDALNAGFDHLASGQTLRQILEPHG